MGKITTRFSNCFVCCKKVDVGLGLELANKRKLICEQFLVLMSRYLDLNRGDDNDHDHYGSKKTLDIKTGFEKRRRKRRKLLSCDNCLPLIESVCAIYKDWSVLQVKLNAGIKSIANLMQDASASMADSAIEVMEDFEEAVDFRIQFIKQALNKLNPKDFPHLALNRVSTDGLPPYGNFCDVVSQQENVAMTTSAVTGTLWKVEPEPAMGEQEDEVDLDVSAVADWQTNSDVEMDPLENDDDHYDDSEMETETPGVQKDVSQKRKEMKTKLTEFTDDVNKPFKCQICGKGFTQQKFTLEHERIHTHPFRCRLCSRRFSLRINLRAHEKIHQEGKANQFQCSVCSKFFLLRAGCKYHIRRVHKGIGDVLGGGDKSKPGIDIRTKKKNEEKPLKCEFCPRRFTRNLDKAKHEYTHRQKSLKCPHCEMTFKRVSVLNRHVDKHLKPYECGLCGSRFSQRDNCRNHQSMVHKVIEGLILKISEEPNPTATVSDDKASKTFEPATNLEIQLKPTPDNDNELEADNATIEDSGSNSADIWQPQSGIDDDGVDADHNDYDDTNNEEKNDSNSNPDQVEVEGAEGNSKRKSRRLTNKELAELRARDPLPFKCEECGKGFPLPGHLTLHLRISHMGIKFQCNTCGTQFNQKVSLNRHLAHKSCHRLLSRSKPETEETDQVEALSFKCTDCDQAFAQPDDLKQHRKTSHNKGVQYQCNICKKNCSDLYVFKQHQNSHTNARPLKCRFCSQRSFNNRTARAYHEVKCDANPLKKGKLERQKHKCSRCDMAFESRGKLQAHAFAKHGVPKTPPPPPSSGKREVICEQCGKVFPNYRSQYNHRVKEHVNGEPYPCSVCGKVFKYLGRLQVHERVHGGPGYECSHCGEKFIWDFSCRNHIKNKHKGQPLIVINLLKNLNKSRSRFQFPIPTGAPGTASEDTPTIQNSQVLETPLLQNESKMD